MRRTSHHHHHHHHPVRHLQRSSEAGLLRPEPPFSPGRGRSHRLLTQPPPGAARRRRHPSPKPGRGAAAAPSGPRACDPAAPEGTGGEGREETPGATGTTAPRPTCPALPCPAPPPLPPPPVALATAASLHATPRPLPPHMIPLSQSQTGNGPSRDEGGSPPCRRAAPPGARGAAAARWL